MIIITKMINDTDNNIEMIVKMIIIYYEKW